MLGGGGGGGGYPWPHYGSDTPSLTMALHVTPGLTMALLPHAGPVTPAWRHYMALLPLWPQYGSVTPGLNMDLLPLAYIYSSCVCVTEILIYCLIEPFSAFLVYNK